MPWRIAVAVALLAAGRLALAADFRVENRVFSGDQQRPTARSTTIFHGGVVYDLLEDPAEATVFDGKVDRVVLVDLKRRVKTEFATAQVVAFCERLQQRAAVHPDPLIQFLAAPKFGERFDTVAKTLTLSSPVAVYREFASHPESEGAGKTQIMSAPMVSYRATLTDVGPEVAAQYRYFSDCCARLNALLDPGSKPPFARLALNASLAGREAIAREVQLTLRPQGKPSSASVTIRSQHELVRELTPQDTARVDELRRQMAGFSQVSFTQYRGGGGGR